MIILQKCCCLYKFHLLCSLEILGGVVMFSFMGKGTVTQITKLLRSHRPTQTNFRFGGLYFFFYKLCGNQVNSKLGTIFEYLVLLNSILFIRRHIKRWEVVCQVLCSNLVWFFIPYSLSNLFFFLSTECIRNLKNDPWLQYFIWS